MSIPISSRVFENGQPIPAKYTQDGDDISPPLRWGPLPAATRELALIVEDPDAPRPQPVVHWVIYKIPAETMGLEEGLPTRRKLKIPPGSLQGTNSANNKIGYEGPAPPRGHGPHHYHFRLYALDKAIDADGGLDNKDLMTVMHDHILDQGELVGTYERKQ